MPAKEWSPNFDRATASCATVALRKLPISVVSFSFIFLVGFGAGPRCLALRRRFSHHLLRHPLQWLPDWTFPQAQRHGPQAAALSALFSAVH